MEENENKNEDKKEKKSNVNDWLKKVNIKNLKKDQLLIIFLVGILLIVIAIPTDKPGAEEKPLEEESKILETDSDLNLGTSYEKELETRLEDTLRKVEGVGNVKVMITLKSSEEKIVEKDVPSMREETNEVDGEGGERISTSSSYDEETVYTQQEDGSSSPYVVKEIKPEIEGVLIIAEGGGNSVVVQNISEAVLALFRLEAHKIKVMKMN